MNICMSVVDSTMLAIRVCVSFTDNFADISVNARTCVCALRDKAPSLPSNQKAAHMVELVARKREARSKVE